jgi:GntR family transcriptional repressor for pyruvate dehydrogenase complex
MTQFQPVKSRRVSDEVGAQIRRMLASRQLKPGDKLPAERELAIHLGVGRNSVREAFRGLEMAGVLLLVKGPKGGAFIARGSTEILSSGLRDLLHLRGATIEQITEARIIIEDSVTRLVCERATENDFAALEACLGAAERAYAARDYSLKLSHLIEFHNVLARATSNPVLITVMAALMTMMHEFGTAAGPEQNDLSMHALRKVMTRLRQRNEAAAVAAMADHLNRLKDRYLRTQCVNGSA